MTKAMRSWWRIQSVCLSLVIEIETESSDLAPGGIRSLLRGSDGSPYAAYSTGRDLSRYGGGGGARAVGGARGGGVGYYGGGGSTSSGWLVFIWVLVGISCTCGAIALLAMLIDCPTLCEICFETKLSNNPPLGDIELTNRGERTQQT